MQLDAMADTGAQMCILGRNQIHKLGMPVGDLEPASLGITIADGGQATNLGMVFLEISVKAPGGGTRVTKQQCYVLDGAGSLFLSYEALVDLGSCPKGFPQVAASNVIGGQHQVQQEPGPGPQAPEELGAEPRTCKCPKRARAPDPPLELPYPATVENIPRLREYIVERYSASAFNTCTHQALPLMKSAPALRLHVDPDATPVAVHRPGIVPAHLMESVKAGLDRDVRTGVLRKVVGQ